MNKLKIAGVTAVASGMMSNQDWLFLVSLLLTALGMIQEYLKAREKNKNPQPSYGNEVYMPNPLP